MIKEEKYFSPALNRGMVYDIYIPDNIVPKKERPWVLLLHGLGRNSKSLTTHPVARGIIEQQKYAIVFPNAENGWYIDSAVKSGSNYLSLINDVYNEVTKKYGLSTKPERTAITGWSMGGYGCTRCAERWNERFSVVAPIIGVLDYPVSKYEGKSDLKLPFDIIGRDESKWVELNPVTHAERLRGKKVFIITGDTAYDLLMNKTFCAKLDELGIAYMFTTVPGNHSLETVVTCLPGVFGFIENSILLW
ncbi:MAG: alpha/beta hydrolase-fold protein [Elusimicrobiota bacterium]